MTRFLYFVKKYSGSAIAGVLVFSIAFAPLSASLELKRAHATWSVVEVGANLVTNLKTTVESTISAVSDLSQEFYQGSLWTKEFALDKIAWQLVNIVIKEMIRSTTKWVNSGFKGNPAFVTDFGKFITDIADKAAGNFIFGTPLALLCSPIRVNIRFALDIQYRKTSDYRAECRLSAAVKNLDNFLNGDFVGGGGWDAWYDVALNPQNNQYGAMLAAQGGLYATISGKQQQQIKLLEFGKGFLSVPDPSCQPSPDNPDGFDPGLCPTVTPGTVVESTLNSALDLPNKRIAIADELNELIGALFAQLAKEVLGGVGGLLGLTESRYGGGNYLDRMASEREALGYSNTSNNSIEKSIAVETKYLRLEQNIVTLITDAEQYKNRVYGSTTNCYPGGLTNSLAQKLSDAKYQVVKTSEVLAKLNTFLTDYKLLESATTSTNVIAALRTKYNATTIPEAEANLMSQYTTYVGSGLLHTDSQIVRIELSFIPELQTEIQTFTNSVDIACRDVRSGSSFGSDG